MSTASQQSGADKRTTATKLRSPKFVDGGWRCDHGHAHKTKPDAKGCNWRNRSVRA